MRSHATFLSIATLFVALAAAQQAAQTSAGTVPQLIPYSGIAKDVSGKPLSGVVGITFLLYQQEQGGSPLWLETQNVQADSRGHYSVQLGATLPHGVPNDLFVSGEARWLGIQIAGQSEAARIMLLSVPYALKAGDAQTLGGLPASAFMLVAPTNGAAPTALSSSAATSSTAAPSTTSSNVTTTGGTVTALPLFTTPTNIQNSAISQTGTGTTARIGIGTATPAATLDVKGAATVRGALALPPVSAATKTTGSNSQPVSIVASSFSSSTNTPVNQTFQWQAESAGNNTAAPSGSLNLLFGQGNTKPSETGLHIGSNGLISFASGQTFPGTGTITGVTAGSGLTGGGTSGAVTLNLDATKVPLLTTGNTFAGNQTVNGNLSATGLVTGSAFNIGSNLFDSGSYTNQNSLLGFAGNTTMTGADNTAAGYQALANNSTGVNNTASGVVALYHNTSGGSNTAHGYQSLYYNTTGSNNVAVGYTAGNSTNAASTTGSNNTFMGSNANPGVQTSLTNATAIGANAQVTASNAMVLGSINGVNGATASTNVGIGTTAPAATLDVHGTGNFTGPISFAVGQTFPGTGTVTSVGSGPGLQGGPITNSGSLSIATGGVNNAMLANPSLTVVAGTDLTGGGPVALGGTTTLNLDTTQVPQLNTSNIFFGNQIVNGNLSALGMVTGSGFQIGINLFDYGTFAANNAFLGFAGNTTMTGADNTAAGRSALLSNVTGGYNTAVGAFALQDNTGDNSGQGYGSGNTAAGYAALALNKLGYSNTAIGVGALEDNTGDSSGKGGKNTATGVFALFSNTTGVSNTAMGASSGYARDFSPVTGDNDTFLGAGTAMSTGTLYNATAVGANAEVGASNALVLGSIAGVNAAPASVNVGIGTTAPGSTLEVQASNAQNLGPVVTITNNAVGPNTGAALDFNTFPPAYGSGYNPTARIQAVDQGNWSSNIIFEANVQGGRNNGLQTNMLIDAAGDVTIRGNLIKGGGSFKIDHPLDPANKYLSHSFVESPDMMNVYNGNVRTDRRGLAVVTLPDYFEALNRDFRYQLTVIGQFAQAVVAREISHNRFTIRTNRPGVKVSWQVTGIRHDAFADAHRIPNEEEKPQQERGHYLHPELFGASPEQAIGIRSLPVSQEDEVDTAQTSPEPR
jgi:hypothetical protein